MIKFYKKLIKNLKDRWKDYQWASIFKVLYKMQKRFNQELKKESLYDSVLNIKEITGCGGKYIQIQTTELKYNKFDNVYYNPCYVLKFKNKIERIKYFNLVNDLLFETSGYYEKSI